MYDAVVNLICRDTVYPFVSIYRNLSELTCNCQFTLTLLRGMNRKLPSPGSIEQIELVDDISFGLIGVIICLCLAYCNCTKV